MARRSGLRWLCVIVLFVVVGGLLWVYDPFGWFTPPQSMTVQLYDVGGNPVGLPLSWVPLSPYRKDNVEVSAFSCRVDFASDDPAVSKVTIDLNLCVVISGSQGASVVRMADLITKEVLKASGSETTGQLQLASYCSDVPAGAFILEFRCKVTFSKGDTVSGYSTLWEGWLNPVYVQMTRVAYTYTADVIPG